MNYRNRRIDAFMTGDFAASKTTFDLQAKMSCIDDNTVDICFVHNSFSSKNITSSVLLSMCYVFTLHETCSMYDDNDVVVVLFESIDVHFFKFK